MDIFNSSGNSASSTLVDATDTYANQGFTVSFQRALDTASELIEFKAFISGFQENYNCDWTTEQVYGRPDPIHMYKSTGRTISLGLLIPASTITEGKENLLRVQRLVQFLYPSYIEANEAQTISESPLVRFKAMSLIGDREFSHFGFEYTEGILAAITSLNVNHNLDNPDSGVFEFDGGIIIPKLIEINVDMSIIHEHSVGWEKNNFQTPAFPYMASDIEVPDPIAAALEPTQGGGTSTISNTSGDAEVLELTQGVRDNRIAKLGGTINEMLQSRRCKKNRVITTSSSGLSLEGEKQTTESISYRIDGCD